MTEPLLDSDISDEQDPLPPDIDRCLSLAIERGDSFVLSELIVRKKARAASADPSTRCSFTESCEGVLQRFAAIEKSFGEGAALDPDHALNVDLLAYQLITKEEMANARAFRLIDQIG